MAAKKKPSSRKAARGADAKSKAPASAEDDIAATYNAFKEFEGRRYTGVKIGRGHRWHYQAGDWKERKVTPDKWEFTYAVNKVRAGKAPEGSGVPVGTQYHWYILAHQTVRKISANEYTTAMIGMKHKLSHMRADKDKWSASDAAQRRKLVRILREMIADLESESEQAAPKEAARESKAAARPRSSEKKPRRRKAARKSS
jgi:hypothetical protein